MFQILDGTGEPFAFTILLGIYKSVANIYDRLLTIAQYDTGSYEKITMNIEAVAGVMYVLAGIFMLFRVTIAMINVLIDPDKLNDRQAGAGKILVRVVTSILMLIIFVPNGIVFNKDTGILARFESAVLNGDDGLVNKLFPTLSYSSNKKNTSNKNHTFLADDVYADVDLDKMKKLDCYYIAIRRTNKYIHYYEDGFLHITFYPNADDSSKEQLFSNYLNDDFTEDDILPISYEIEENDDGHGLKYIKPNLSSLRTVPILDSEKLMLKEWSCPNYVTEYGELKRARNGLEWSEGLEVNGPLSYIGGYGSSEAMFQGARDHNVDIQADGDGVDTSSLEELLDSYNPTVPTANANDEEEYLESLRKTFDNDESLVFAQNALATFITCTGTTDEKKNECEDLLYGRKDGNEKRDPYTGVIVNRVTNEDIKDKLKDNWFVKDKIMSLDFVTAMIAGVGLFVWIAVLCVDIFIRRFKLILLEMMAPIPIISYSDPNDKMFNQWGKMYISTYAELFLKLFAMAFAIRLLAAAYEVEARGLEKFFWLVAILVFAKTIPDIISKVTGLNINTGTFKNIVGMGKAALGFGAGAAIGGVVGAASALGTGGGLGLAIKSGLKGTLRGAGSGAKGKIFGGADSIRTENLNTRRANYNHSTAAGRRQAAFKKFFGQSDAYESKKKKLDEFEVKELQPKKEAKSAMDAFIDSKENWEKAVIQQRNYRNFDDKVSEVAQYFKAKEALEGMRTSASATKAAWYKEQEAKRNKLAAQAKASGSLADKKALDDFELNFAQQYGLSDGEFMTQIGSDFINDKAKEVSELDYKSQLAVYDYEINKINNDPTYEGIAGTEGLFDKVKERAEELNTNSLYQSKEYGLDGHQIVLDRYTTDEKTGTKGLKSTGTKVDEKRRDIGATIGREERELATERRELENSGIKADHDAISGGK